MKNHEKISPLPDKNDFFYKKKHEKHENHENHEKNKI
jgi:hypothetical protein